MKGVKLALVAVVIACAAYSAWDTFQTSIGLDFYQMWGIGRARKASDVPLPSPYLAKDRYGKLLDDNARATPDERFQVANKTNHRFYASGLEPTGSPLVFAVFALFPEDYSQSYRVFQTCGIGLFALAVLLTFKRLDNAIPMFLVLVFSVFLYEPFRLDENLGNINLFQFSAVSTGLYFLGRLMSQRHGSFLHDSLFLGMVVLVTLLKPNLALVSAAFVALLLSRRDIKQRAKLAGVLAGSFVALLVIPCLYFRAFDIWESWLEYIGTGNKLNFALFNGNLSTSAVISYLSGSSANGALIVILILGAIAAAVAGARCLPSLLTTPDACVAMAIIVTIAVSPLVWWHYYLIMLVPIVWLVDTGPIAGGLGVVSLLLTSNLISLIDKKLYVYNVFIVPSSWIPLLIGVLLACRSQRSPGLKVPAELGSP